MKYQYAQKREQIMSVELDAFSQTEDHMWAASREHHAEVPVTCWSHHLPQDMEGILSRAIICLQNG